MNIYSNNDKAARVIHPGLAVLDELEALGMSQSKASKVLGLSKQALQQLCQGELDITPSIATALEQLGSGDASFWLALQQNYNLHPKRGGNRVGAGRKKKNFISKQVRISAPNEEMAKIEIWLKTQPNTSRALAALILQAQ